MANYKRVKLYIESEGYMYITSKDDLSNWEEVVTDENEQKLKKVEVVEEFDLPHHLFEYVTSDEFDDSLEQEMEEFISRERIKREREDRINDILS